MRMAIGALAGAACLGLGAPAMGGLDIVRDSRYNASDFCGVRRVCSGGRCLRTANGRCHDVADAVWLLIAVVAHYAIAGGQSRIQT